MKISFNKYLQSFINSQVFLGVLFSQFRTNFGCKKSTFSFQLNVPSRYVIIIFLIETSSREQSEMSHEQRLTMNDTLHEFKNCKLLRLSSL